MTRKVKQERVLKTAECPSLSGASTLTYHVGINPKDELQFRIWENDGGGLFAKEWVLWKTLESALDTDKPVTAGYLKRTGVCRGKSANTPGFLLAALKAEGLVEARDDGGYRKADPSGWLEQMQQLIAE